MGFPIGKVVSFATRALAAIVTGVPAVQTARQQLGSGSGADARVAILALVQAELSAAEIATGRDLANDAAVLEAAGHAIDAVVAFHKVVAKQAAAPAA